MQGGLAWTAICTDPQTSPPTSFILLFSPVMNFLPPSPPTPTSSSYEIFILRLSEYDFIWRQRLHGGGHGEVSSLGWALTQRDGCPSIKGKLGYRPAQGKRYAMMKAEVKGMLLEAKECQRWPASWGMPGNRSSLKALGWGGGQHCQHLDLGLPASRTVRGWNRDFRCSGPSAFGTLSQQPQQVDPSPSYRGTEPRLRRDILEVSWARRTLLLGACFCVTP